MIKTCSRCLKTKDVKDFSFCRTPKHASKDGYSAWCKMCFADYNRERRKEGKHKDIEKRFKEKVKQEYGSLYYKYKNKFIARQKKYDMSEKGKLTKKISKMNRKHREHGKLSSQQIRQLIKFYAPKRQCLRCGMPTKLELDHVTPISRGGTNTIDNIQVLCSICNRQKWAYEIDYRFDGGKYARSLL